MTEDTETAERVTAGEAMHDFIRHLYPMRRSITGPGVRETLRAIQEHIPLSIESVQSGTSVLDWTVPNEWTIRDAYIADADGRRRVDLRDNSLHVMSYSVPVRATLSRSDLEPHLHTIPDQPDRIPYRTSYYNENWGFCLSENQKQDLGEGPFDVVIDSSLDDGVLNYGEFVLPGETDREVLLSCHICHPALCNDNLSGIAVCTWLANRLRHQAETEGPLRYTYRFLFVPGTIGPITWLANHQADVHRIDAGLVVACVGDPGPFTYKQSRQGDTLIDRVVERVLAEDGGDLRIRPFIPYGYDERQYGSPGFDLPVGSLTRTPFGEYPEYHTSADDLQLVTADALAESLRVYHRVIRVLEDNRTFVNQSPYGEPQLGRRGIYREIGGHTDTPQRQLAMLWVLNQSDGYHSLLDIADRSGLPFELLHEVAEMLLDKDLLADGDDVEPIRPRSGAPADEPVGGG